MSEKRSITFLTLTTEINNSGLQLIKRNEAMLST